MNLLFQNYVAVDWSAANTPKLGRDSIWLGQHGDTPINLSTRAEAMAEVRARLHAALAAGDRTLIGFDFAFGYPAGTAERWGGRDWRDVWALIHDLVEDTPKNASNRFDVASTLNQRMGLPAGPFWGHPKSRSYDYLHWGKPKTLFQDFPEWRESDSQTPGAHSVWKLMYAGAVGSQTLLGIAALEALRRDSIFSEHIAIWPFETDFAENLSKPIIIAEIFPTSHGDFPNQPYVIKDAQQVAQVVEDMASWDAVGELRDKLNAPGLTGFARENVRREEGWIMAS